MKKLKNILMLFGVAAACILLLVFSIREAGAWLLVDDQISSGLDLIFTFAGDRNRVDYSSELMIKYPDAHWVMSDFKNGYINYVSKKGFDLSRITVVDTCVSTISEVKSLFGYLKDRQKQNPQKMNVGLVSSPYHMRRIKLMIKSQAKMKNVNFAYLPVPLKAYNVSNEMYKYWWKHKNISDVVISEYQKILYFYIFNNK